LFKPQYCKKERKKERKKRKTNRRLIQCWRKFFKTYCLLMVKVFYLKNSRFSWAKMADAYNLIYLGSRDCEDHVSKPGRAESL
jgi:hypothetical protein